MVVAMTSRLTAAAARMPPSPKSCAPISISTRQNFIAYESSMLGCVKDASATTAMQRMVCGINQPELMLNSPRISAPITDRDMPSEVGVFSEASFSASIASSSSMNCQKIAIA